MLKSKSLEISPNVDEIHPKTQEMEDEKKELKEFERAMNRSKIKRKDSDSDSMGSPKDLFIRASGGSTTSDHPSSPKFRAVKQMSVRDLKSPKREKLSSSLPVDDSKTQSQVSTAAPGMHFLFNNFRG